MSENKYQWIKGDSIGKVETLKEIITVEGKEYVLFNSNKRVARNVLNEYLVEYNDGGDIYIDSRMLDESVNIPPLISNSKANNTSTGRLNKEQTKSDQFTLTDIINRQLEKNNEIITIEIEVPVLKKEYVDMLIDTNPSVIDDLTKIVMSKYINKEELEKIINDKINSFYSRAKIIEKTRPQIIDIVTEKIK